MSANDPDADLFKLVNDSGFPFQMAVTYQIEQSVRVHRWKVIAEEHPWKHPESNREGFVDQILRHELDNAFRALLECKRLKEGGKWVFLTPPDHPEDSTRLSVFWTAALTPRQTGRGWFDIDFTPKSPESSFCVLLGDNDKRTMFEHIADGLLPATESVGLEEVKLNPPLPDQVVEPRCYLPIVITNASLHTASFDPGELDMKSGRLPAGKCDFKEVPSVRFRKSLGTHVTLQTETQINHGQEGIAEANRLSQRTILVLNSNSLSALLKELRLFEKTRNYFGGLMDSRIKSTRQKFNPT
jgi:hypothetical protein